MLRSEHLNQWQDYKGKDMATLLARKANGQTPVATDDDHHTTLASDPSVAAFPANSSFSGGFDAPMPPSSFGSMPTSQGDVSMTTQQQAPAAPQPVLTGAGSNAAQGADVLVANDNTDWINKKWRPVMGWVYMLTCTSDFVVFPILWSLLQALSHGSVTTQWQPLTLQGAGLYHIAMGAVLGIAAYGRTKEKVAGAA
jgi:hypothetical protein